MPINDALADNYRTSLDKVPQKAQAAIKLVTNLVANSLKNKLVMVWLFGSYARGEAINDRRISQETGTLSEYYSDIDILVVVRGSSGLRGQPSRWSRLCKRVAEHPDIPFTIHMMSETLPRLNEAIENGEYFYRDVISEGVVLFSTINQLSKAKDLSPHERREWAVKYFERFYTRAVAMRQSVGFHYQLDDYGSSIYTLHQMTEHLCHTYLLVFTHYKPRSHDLGELRNRVAAIDKQVLAILTENTEQEKVNFELLNQAYVDARYKTVYNVDKTVLEALITRVSAFQIWVYDSCLAEIDKLVLWNNYSEGCEVVKGYMALAELQKKELPQAIVIQQLEALRVAELREREALQEVGRALSREENALDKFDQERLEKEAAELRESKEREEKERLLQKLRDAGIDPDGVE